MTTSTETTKVFVVTESGGWVDSLVGKIQRMGLPAECRRSKLPRSWSAIYILRATAYKTTGVDRESFQRIRLFADQGLWVVAMVDGDDKEEVGRMSLEAGAKTWFRSGRVSDEELRECLKRPRGT